MTNFDIELLPDQSLNSRQDFVTLEDDLPASVSLLSGTAKDGTTSFTDVKHETTDDN